MNEEQLDKRIEDANNLMVNFVEEPVADTTNEPQPMVDVYQRRRNAQYAMPKRQARGANSRIKLDLTALQDSGVTHAYKKAKDDSDYYTSIGNKQYARMIKRAYMEDKFLPVVDALVRLNGLGAVLANPDTLKTHDALTLLDGGVSDGYTQAYLTSMYELDDQPERTDQTVEKAIRLIKVLCDNDEISSAVAKAKEIKKHIDAGENMATNEDYELIQKVALYGS